MHRSLRGSSAPQRRSRRPPPRRCRRTCTSLGSSRARFGLKQLDFKDNEFKNLNGYKRSAMRQLATLRKLRTYAFFVGFRWPSIIFEIDVRLELVIEE